MSAPPALSSRRQFLRTVGTGLAAATLARAMPASFARRPHSLVLIQLAGGNDGFNTLVPLHDASYHRLRPTLALTRSDALPLNERFALNRAAEALRPLYDEGKVAVLPNVGFPFAVDSHYRATELWRTGSIAELASVSSWTERCGPAIACPQFDRDGTDFAAQLHQVGQHIASGDTAEIYSFTLPGFDTHYEQARRHPARLQLLAKTLSNFQTQLTYRGVAERVTTAVFSEFGRSLAENQQGGTDHGNSSPVFVVGDAVRGGIQHEPSDGRIDFRQVIASLAHDWLGVARAAAINDDTFAPLPLFHSSLS